MAVENRQQTFTGIIISGFHNAKILFAAVKSNIEMHVLSERLDAVDVNNLC